MVSGRCIDILEQAVRESLLVFSPYPGIPEVASRPPPSSTPELVDTVHDMEQDSTVPVAQALSYVQPIIQAFPIAVQPEAIQDAVASQSSFQDQHSNLANQQLSIEQIVLPKGRPRIEDGIEGEKALHCTRIRQWRDKVTEEGRLDFLNSK